MTSLELLERVVVDPPGPPDASVVWLHGLGADGHDFPPIVAELGLPPDHGVRFVFPHAPQIPVTINGGMVMRAWYDILTLDLERRADEAGVQRSAAQAADLIAHERAQGIESERILLAGFSQGGAIALHQGLRHPEPLGGIIATSTYLPVEVREADLSPTARTTPVFQAHGSMDPMVEIARGRAAHDRLIELGLGVEWHEYPMMHQVCLEEIEALGAWMRGRLDLRGA
jgi:phospholipase/carboxylesterase